RVRKFAELQQKIDDLDVFIDEALAPPAAKRSSPFQPYDAYDAYEFGRDLAGRELSTLELSKLEHDRFPEWSNESRRFMVQYLIENGVAEVVRTTSAGRPTRYRFAALGRGGDGGRRMRLGVPGNEVQEPRKGRRWADLNQKIFAVALVSHRQSTVQLACDYSSTQDELKEATASGRHHGSTRRIVLRARN